MTESLEVFKRWTADCPAPLNPAWNSNHLIQDHAKMLSPAFAVNNRQTTNIFTLSKPTAVPRPNKVPVHSLSIHCRVWFENDCGRTRRQRHGDFLRPLKSLHQTEGLENTLTSTSLALNAEQPAPRWFWNRPWKAEEVTVNCDFHRHSESFSVEHHLGSNQWSKACDQQYFRFLLVHRLTVALEEVQFTFASVRTDLQVPFEMKSQGFSASLSVSFGHKANDSLPRLHVHAFGSALARLTLNISWKMTVFCQTGWGVIFEQKWKLPGIISLPESAAAFNVRLETGGNLE